jgi:hypothetical protein
MLFEILMLRKHLSDIVTLNNKTFNNTNIHDQKCNLTFIEQEFYCYNLNSILDRILSFSNWPFTECSYINIAGHYCNRSTIYNRKNVSDYANLC